MVKKSIQRKLFTKSLHLIPLILVILILFSVGGYIVIAHQQNTLPPTSTLQQHVIPYVRYTSNNLGVSFTYPTQAGGGNFFAKEIGNKIYLYDDIKTGKAFTGTDAEFLSSDLSNGYSIEVFYKIPSISLTDAIQQALFNENEKKNCAVTTTSYGQQRVDNSYQRAVINFQNDPHPPVAHLNDAATKCPRGYVDVGRGIKYFMMNPKFPNKFLFVHVGQGNISSGDVAGTWDTSIVIFK